MKPQNNVTIGHYILGKSSFVSILRFLSATSASCLNSVIQMFIGKPLGKGTFG